MQHHLQHDGIEGRVGERQTVHIGLPHGAVGELLARQAGARQGQHGLRRIHAQRLANAGGQHFQHAAGAGADIEQVPGLGDRGKQRLFHRVRRQFQRPHLVPIGTGAAKTLRSFACAFGEHAGGLAAIGFERGIVGWQAGDQLAGEIAVGAGREREPDIRSFPHPIQQVAFDQEFQVAGQARLRLAEDFGELHHAKRTARRQRQQTQSRGFGGGSEAGQELVHGQLVT